MSCEGYKLSEMTDEELRSALEFHLEQPSIVTTISKRVEEWPTGPVTITETHTHVDGSNIVKIWDLREELNQRRSGPIDPAHLLPLI